MRPYSLRAILVDADLTGANLFSAVLQDADLTNAIFTAANLFSADLTGAINANVEGARLCGTTMPDGTQSDRDC